MRLRLHIYKLIWKPIDNRNTRIQFSQRLLWAMIKRWVTQSIVPYSVYATFAVINFQDAGFSLRCGVRDQAKSQTGSDQPRDRHLKGVFVPLQQPNSGPSIAVCRTAKFKEKLQLNLYRRKSWSQLCLNKDHKSETGTLQILINSSGIASDGKKMNWDILGIDLYNWFLDYLSYLLYIYLTQQILFLAHPTIKQAGWF